MARKSNRALWTAKLSGQLPDGAQAGSVPAALPAAAAAGVTASRAGVASSTLRPAASPKAPGAALQLPAATVAQAGKLAVKTADAAAKIGHRKPFHGVVLGLDPSLRGTGIAVVRFSPPEQPRLLFSTTVRNKASLTTAQCLGAIARAVADAVETYRPVCVALEQTVYVQNVRVSLVLGSARGAAMAPAALEGLEIFEYAPLRLKQAVVGNGRASKQQVAGMVRNLLQAGRDLLPSDEADAAAVALCHGFTVRL